MFCCEIGSEFREPKLTPPPPPKLQRSEPTNPPHTHTPPPQAVQKCISVNIHTPPSNLKVFGKEGGGEEGLKSQSLKVNEAKLEFPKGVGGGVGGEEGCNSKTLSWEGYGYFL